MSPEHLLYRMTADNIDIDMISDRLRSAGLKATVQRVLVYKALVELEHASVDAIVEVVHRTMPAVTVAAVYRILEAMADAGLIGRLYSYGGKMFDITPGYHDHLVTSSGLVADVEDTALRTALSSCVASMKLDGYRIKGARIFLEVEEDDGGELAVAGQMSDK